MNDTMRKNEMELWGYFCLTFLWSWSLLMVPIVMGWSYDYKFTKILFFAAGIAPSATGIILAYFKREKDYWKDFWHRTLNFKLIKVKWYLIIFSFVPLTSLIAILFVFFLWNDLPDFETLHHFFREPLQLFPFTIYMLLFGPLAEEIGWRGYALDHLEQKYSWLTSSLILGFFWSLWHLPMFFIEGTYQNILMDRSVFLFIDFFVAIFAMSIVMDWVYNHNNRSILAGVLIHFCTNFFGEIFELPDMTMYIRTAVQIVFAIFIIVYLRNAPFRNQKMTNN